MGSLHSPHGQSGDLLRDGRIKVLTPLDVLDREAVIDCAEDNGR